MDPNDDPISAGEQQQLLHNSDTRRWRRKRSGLGIWCIYITEFLERIAFYSLLGNLIFLLNRVELNWTSANAATINFMTNGISYVSSFIAGIVSTYCLGKFATSIIAFVVYIVGYSLYPFLKQSGVAPVTTPSFVVDVSNQISPLFCPNNSYSLQMFKPSYHKTYSNISASSYFAVQSGLYDDDPFNHACVNDTDPGVVSLHDEPCFSIVTLTLALIGVAVGSIKSNLVPLGVDQCGANPERTRRFVNRFYWFTNAGAGVAYVGIIYMQQAVNTFYGLFVPLCLLLLAACVFAVGRLCYTPVEHTDVPSTQSLSILYYLFRRRACCDSRRRTMYPHDELTRQIAPQLHNGKVSCWDVAKQSYGGKFFDDHVNDLRSVCEIGAIFITLIPFWMVYSQMQTTFVIQGWHMQFFPSLSNGTCRLNENNDYLCQLIQVPAAALNAFNILAVIILIPIANWFYRLCETRLRRKITYIERIVVGHVFACTAMCVAGWVETARLNAFWGNSTLNASDPQASTRRNQVIVQIVGQTPYYAPEMLIFWQIPQYFLIGLAEVLATIATLEYACARAPMRLNAVVMGFYWLVDGIANFFGMAVLQGVRGWLLFDDDCRQGLGINCRLPCNSPTGFCVCHLDYYFFLLAGVAAVGLLWFFGVAMWLDMDQRQKNASIFGDARRNADAYYSNGITVPHHTECEASIDVVYNRQASYQQSSSGGTSSTYTVNTTRRIQPYSSSEYDSRYRAFE